MHPRVAVLGGGASPEHEVSLRSAAEVLNALARLGYPTLAVWIDPDDRWHACGAAPDVWTGDALRGCGARSPGVPSLRGVLDLAGCGIDVVFPALHGRAGEDGQVQSLLDAGGLPYVGSGRTASAIGLSKLHTRLALTALGLPMPRAWLPSRAAALAMPVEQIGDEIEREGLSYPLFLKEDACGSSLNVERIVVRGALRPALARVRAAGDYWVLEEGVTGVEVTCAVIGNSGGALRALPPVQIRPRAAAFFDYESKYDAAATEELCPPPDLLPDVVSDIQRIAVAAHEAIGCRGFSRTDMIVAESESGDSEPKVLEINTMPGLTPESLVPKAARAAGSSFAGLLAQLVELALAGDEPVVELPRSCGRLGSRDRRVHEGIL